MKTEINLVMSSSKEYGKYANVVLYSLFKNNVSGHKVNVFFFHTEEMDREIGEMKKTTERYGNNFKDIFVNQELIDFEYNTGSWNNAVWYRFLCISELKGQCDRVLILGTDTLVVDDIYDFYMQDFGNYSAILVKDMWMDADAKNGSRDAYNNAIKPGGYGNSDVCLLNLQGSFPKFSLNDMLKEQKKYNYHWLDQDVLNYSYGEQIKVVSDIRYNYMVSAAEYLYSYEEQKDWIKKASILHYAGDKPWNTYKGRYCEDIWYTYAQEAGCICFTESQKREKLYEGVAAIRDTEIRLRTNYSVLYEILELCQHSKTPNAYFKRRNVKSIGLYGAGRLCEILISMIQKYVNIAFVVDCDEYKLMCGDIPVISCDEYRTEREKIDLLIITVPYDIDNIIANIKNDNNVVCEMISIMDFLKEFD